MSPLIQKALGAIESGSLSEIADGFLTLAEVVSANRIHNYQSDIIPEANNEILEWSSLENIQQAVKRWIDEHPLHSSVSSAFWVLDKFRDDSLKPFLQHWLDSYVQRVLPNLAPLGQILVALDSLGEQSISNGSYSSAEHGKNFDDAVRYLRLTSPKRKPIE